MSKFLCLAIIKTLIFKAQALERVIHTHFPYFLFLLTCAWSGHL